VAERVEVAAAKLLVSIAEAKNERIEGWIINLSKETPNGVPAFSEPPMYAYLVLNDKARRKWQAENARDDVIVVTPFDYRDGLEGRKLESCAVDPEAIELIPPATVLSYWQTAMGCGARFNGSLPA
jgi:hypothetical protein